MKIVWQTSDNDQMSDLADAIYSLNGEGSLISTNINLQIDNSNTVNEGNGIVIDGYFADWADVMKTPDLISSASSQNININEYAAVEENDRQYIYLSVIGDKILNGVEIPSASAKSSTRHG